MGCFTGSCQKKQVLSLYNFTEDFTNFFYKLESKVRNIVDGQFKPCWEYADIYSERIKATLLCVGACFIFLMVVSPYGWLYACLPRPFTALPLLYWGIIPHDSFPTPEYGIHLITIVIYSYACYSGIVHMEKQGINRPFHKLAYMLFLTILTFYVPFEWIYITLYDVFHNIPIYGYPVIWFFGWWKDTLGFIVESVIGVDGILTVSSIIGMYIIKKDLGDYFPIKFRINKVSALLFLSFILWMGAWVIIPLSFSNQDLPVYGTKWFPQTIYVKYGYFEEYNLPIPLNGDIYGIVEEYWYPNDIIKYHNHIAKLFSVAFMFYTFTPRVKENNLFIGGLEMALTQREKE